MTPALPCWLQSASLALKLLSSFAAEKAAVKVLNTCNNVLVLLRETAASARASSVLDDIICVCDGADYITFHGPIEKDRTRLYDQLYLGAHVNLMNSGKRR